VKTGLSEGWENGLITEIEVGSVKLRRRTRSTTATTWTTGSIATTTTTATTRAVRAGREEFNLNVDLFILFRASLWGRLCLFE